MVVNRFGTQRREYWVLTESRIPLKPARVVALSISSDRQTQ